MKVGVIGGSGLYDVQGLDNVQQVTLDTPFGAPSGPYVCGRLSGVEVAFLPRHGRGHVLLPSEVNYRANIYGMKTLGVGKVVSVAAVGSFREGMAPRDIVMVGQFVDRMRRGQQQTFFGDGIAAHIAFADPVCACLRGVLFGVARDHLAGLPPGPAGRPPMAHPRGTYLNMEGPAFSTRAESRLYRSWGMDVIGMTNMAEARLAREAEICYATMATVTDYDCWHSEHESVSVDMLIETLVENSRAASVILAEALPRLVTPTDCECGRALASAVITDPALFPEGTRRRLDPFLDKYYPGR